MITQNKYTPNGISIEQIKKYAKKLKKNTELTFQQALDQIINEKTNFHNWNILKEYCDNLGGSISKVKLLDNSIVIYKNKNAIYANYEIGSDGNGKALGILLKSNFKKILFIEKRDSLSQQNLKYNELIDQNDINISSLNINSKRNELMNQIKNQDAIIIPNIDSYSNYSFIDEIIKEAQANSVTVFFISAGIFGNEIIKRSQDFILKYTAIFIGREPIKNNDSTFDNLKGLVEYSDEENEELCRFLNKDFNGNIQTERTFTEDIIPKIRIIDIGLGYKGLLPEIPR